MNGNSFIDSNVCVYIFDNDIRKKEIAVNLLLSSNAVISTQVVMETANVAGKKLKLKLPEIKEAVNFIYSLCTVQLIDKLQIEKALSIHNDHKYSLYDSLIVASALYSGCNILYSEDMQHNREFENSLMIINPFI
jgi:predicted nucleic acid-binding protein